MIAASPGPDTFGWQFLDFGEKIQPMLIVVRDNPFWSMDWLPETIKQASAKDLGIAALSIIALSILAYKLFSPRDRPIVRVFIFCVLFVGFGTLVGALVKMRDTATCAKQHDEPFQPGSHKTGRSLGDCGGGTSCDEWLFSWTAPHAVTSVVCTPAAYQRTLAQNSDGNVATCRGWINGGNMAITMVVQWKEPCSEK
jgi:hypothetical protein